jgi:hypothetical protein
VKIPAHTGMEEVLNKFWIIDVLIRIRMTIVYDSSLLEKQKHTNGIVHIDPQNFVEKCNL